MARKSLKKNGNYMTDSEGVMASHNAYFEAQEALYYQRNGEPEKALKAASYAKKHIKKGLEEADSIKKRYPAKKR